MPRFVYQVRNNQGATLTGALTAGDLGEASRHLRGEGNVILDLHEKADARTDARARRGRTRIKHKEVIFFANQLAVMVDTGVPLSDALDAIAEQAESHGFRAVVTDVADQVKAGTDFSAALARHPKVFADLFVAMVRASEASGTMGKMLERVARHLLEQRRLVRRVRGAMAYPLAMLAFCILVVTAMLIFVLPRFEKIYAGKSAVLPAPTRVLLAASRGLITYWPVVLACLAGAVAAGGYLLRRPGTKIVLDRARLRMPVVGGMFKKAALSRSLRTLATMMASGVGVLEALEVTAGVTGNFFYRNVWLHAADKIKEGAALSDELFDEPLIPRSVTQMVAAGEKTGRLPTVLDRVADFCDEELDASIRTVLSFIEPTMIVIMGGIVGGIALAMLLPVMSLSRVMSR